MDTKTEMPIVGASRNLSWPSASSSKSPCICLPLHLNCNPETCSTLALYRATRHSPRGTPNTEPISDTDSPLLLCSRLDFRQPAIEGCMTCAALYAGLRSPPKSDYADWLEPASDEDVVVEIKAGTDFVQVRHKNNEHRQRANFTFYSLKDSSMCHVSCILFNLVCIFEKSLTYTDHRKVCQAFARLAFLSEGTGSPVSFGQASKWLKQCQDHPRCCSQAPTELPKRVIDIGPSNDPVRRERSQVVELLSIC